MKYPIEITVYRDPRRRGVRLPADSPKDAGARRRPIDDGGRRKTTTTPPGIYTEIYDMGLLAEDDGTDISFNKLLTLTPTTRDDGFGNFEYTGFTLTDTAYTTAFNSFFGTDYNSWADTYSKVGPIFRGYFGSAFPYPDAGAYVEGLGWLTGGGPVNLPNKAAWNFFNTLPGTQGGLGYTKITRTPSYTAPPVSGFSQDRNADLFLTPRIFRNLGRSQVKQRHTSTPDYRDATIWLANYLLMAKPRSYFLSNSYWNTYLGVPSLIDRGFNNFYPGMNAFPSIPGGSDVYPPATPLEPVDVRDNWRSHNQGIPGARLRKLVLNSGTAAIDSDSMVAVAGFPAWDGTTQFDNKEGAPSYAYADTQEHGLYIAPGMLLGAMRFRARGDDPEQWYFFWRIATNSAWNLSTGGASSIGGGSFAGDHWSARV